MSDVTPSPSYATNKTCARPLAGLKRSTPSVNNQHQVILCKGGMGHNVKGLQSSTDPSRGVTAGPPAVACVSLKGGVHPSEPLRIYVGYRVLQGGQPMPGSAPMTANLFMLTKVLPQTPPSATTSYLGYSRPIHSPCSSPWDFCSSSCCLQSSRLRFAPLLLQQRAQLLHQVALERTMPPLKLGLVQNPLPAPPCTLPSGLRPPRPLGQVPIGRVQPFAAGSIPVADEVLDAEPRCQ